MQGRWAFSWVQRLAHQFNGFAWGLVLLTLVVLSGLWVNGLAGIEQMDWPLLLGSVVLMSLVAMRLMDSVRTGWLLLFCSVLVLATLAGSLAWLGVALDEQAVLGVVVVVFMMMSNLVHVFSSVLREMARGSFQHDAIAEALKMNVMPILLTNATTSLGFVVVAWFDSDYVSIAILVGLGALVSYLLLLSWVPMMLLRGFLEFRVGHYEDRHGFVHLAEVLRDQPWFRWTTLAMFVLLSGISLVVMVPQLDSLQTLGWMLLGSFGVLLVVWRDVKVVALTLFGCLMVVLWVLAGVDAFFGLASVSTFVLVVPLGMVLDDAIHYFSRFIKSKRGYFNDAESCHRFALASVGRPIWLTTQLLVVGMLVLSFSQHPLIEHTSLVTLISVLLASYVVLLWMPALHLRVSK